MNDLSRPRTALYGATLVFMCWLAGYAAFSAYISRLTFVPAARADAVIVLTGGAGRIGLGLEILAAGQGRHLFITGVNNQVDMPTVMRMWHGKNSDIVACCVTLGHQAHNTHQNAAEARKWVSGVRDVRSAYIVTSGYHMPRTLLEFRQALPGIALYPAPVAYGSGPDHDQKNFWHLAFSEYNKTLLTWLRVTLTPKRELDL